MSSYLTVWHCSPNRYGHALPAGECQSIEIMMTTGVHLELRDVTAKVCVDVR